MDTDLALILGIVLAGFSVPSIMSAISDRRPPRAPIILILVAGTLILYAMIAKPGGYSFAQVPDVFFSVLARFIP